MANEELVVRVDNRLIHGQTAVMWKEALNFDRIVVPDDEVMHNSMIRQLMRMSVATSNAKSYFSLVNQAPKLIKKLSQEQSSLLTNKKGNPIFIVCRNPFVVRKLIEGGVKFNKVSIWNMFADEGKQKVVGSVYMNKKDREDVEFIKQAGVRVVIQETPFSKEYEL
ncbi:N-acetylgalactosamine-specific phosphotransferase enzyme IIB component 1 [Pediococcus damnosus]|uniref:PTS sugar transporter subunit IIB n=1 Tax=Pediococcus damnosus TaxID=51663 RepID=UPI00114407B5|nr:PTS sugar transporter subunit IIB [Pediococcus damnosus]GEA92465.1 N-acetylgalactosamine-specific phosphotransferase enzyme IIB component 1 [Pediococcus damnosus]